MLDDPFLLLTDKEKSTKTIQNLESSFFRIASNVPNALFVILNVAFGQRFELRKRICGSLGFILALFVIVTALARADSDKWQRPFLILVSLSLLSVIHEGKTCHFLKGS